MWVWSHFKIILYRKWWLLQMHSVCIYIYKKKFLNLIKTNLICKLKIIVEKHWNCNIRVTMKMCYSRGEGSDCCIMTSCIMNQTRHLHLIGMPSIILSENINLQRNSDCKPCRCVRTISKQTIFNANL